MLIELINWSIRDRSIYYSAQLVYLQSKYEERFVGDLLKSSGSDVQKAVAALQEQERSGREKQPKIIVRGMTYYKSDPVEEADTEESCKYNCMLPASSFKGLTLTILKYNRCIIVICCFVPHRSR